LASCREVEKIYISKRKGQMYNQHVRLSFQPLIFSQPIVFFSHTKSVNSTFSRLFLAQANKLNNCSLQSFAYSRKTSLCKELPHETTKGGSLCQLDIEVEGGREGGRQLDIEVEGGREGGSAISSGTGLCVDLGGECLCNARVV
jgi:hypothetical protein